MKLLNFEFEGNKHFGLAMDSYVVSFTHLMNGGKESDNPVADMLSYLENLPESFNTALSLHDKARSLPEKNKTNGFIPLDQVKILPVLQRPVSLIDFGLTPRHLINSGKTLLKYEFGSILGTLASKIVSMKIKKMSGTEPHLYYKSNHLTVIGDHDEIGWPKYASYLDIEPELCMVTGNSPDKIAGYTIFNDASARDVQFPEMMGTGPARCKDFSRSNGLGPFLVTPDEIPDPLGLKVEVSINDRYQWYGHTSEYSIQPETVINYLETIFSLQPGMVVGMGTIPDCTGLDNDQWLLPRDHVRITFEKLGTLHQKVPSSLPKLEPSRWPKRMELEKYQRED